MAELIPWDEVPNGSVWAKKAGEEDWTLFEREADGRIHNYGLLMAETTIDPQDYPLWEFARAEQGPGELAGQLQAQGAALADALTRTEQAEADLATLRAGISALEQEMWPIATETRYEEDLAHVYAEKWADRLAALHDGRE